MKPKSQQKEKFSQSKLDDKISFLSKKIISLADNLQANTFFSIISTADVVLEYERIEIRQSESSRTRFRILNALITHSGSLTLTEISKKVFRSKYSTTRVINKLLKEGLVRKEVADDDLRSKNISITTKGIEFIERTLPKRQKVSDLVTSCLTKKQMVTLMNLQNKIRKHLLSLITTRNSNT